MFNHSSRSTRLNYQRGLEIIMHIITTPKGIMRCVNYIAYSEAIRSFYYTGHTKAIAYTTRPEVVAMRNANVIGEQMSQEDRVAYFLYTTSA